MPLFAQSAKRASREGPCRATFVYSASASAEPFCTAPGALHSERRRAEGNGVSSLTRF